MPKVELVYDRDCPNVSEARAQLRRAFARTRLEPSWREWQADAPDCPEHARGYGSPTILIDGRDVAGAERGVRASCRLYARPDGSMRGVPSVEMIEAALATSEP